MLKSTRGNVRLEEKRKLSSHSPRALRTIQLPFACFSFHLSFPLGYVDLQAAMPAKRTEERRAFPMRCCKYVCANTQPSRRASSPPPPLNPRSTLGSSSPPIFGAFPPPSPSPPLLWNTSLLLHFSSSRLRLELSGSLSSASHLLFPSRLRPSQIPLGSSNNLLLSLSKTSAFYPRPIASSTVSSIHSVCGHLVSLILKIGHWPRLPKVKKLQIISRLR